MNGLSVAGMAIGATIALPEMLRRGYDKIMITGVVQAGSSLGILVPPSVVLVLYGMIARESVGQLWLAGALPGLMMAGLFIIYIVIRCRVQPHLGPTVSKEERDLPMSEKFAAAAGRNYSVSHLLFHDGGFFSWALPAWLKVQLSAPPPAATLAALFKRRLNRKVMEETIRQDFGNFLHVHVDHSGSVVLWGRI